MGLAGGAALVLWIVVQLALLQHYLFFLQPVVAGLGLVEIALALYWRHLVGPVTGSCVTRHRRAPWDERVSFGCGRMAAR